MSRVPLCLLAGWRSGFVSKNFRELVGADGVDLDGDGVRADLRTPEANDTFPAPDLQEIQQEGKKLEEQKSRWLRSVTS